MIQIVDGKRIYVERQDDGRWAAYASEANPEAFGGFCGFGESIAEAIEDLRSRAASKPEPPAARGNLLSELFD